MKPCVGALFGGAVITETVVGIVGGRARLKELAASPPPAPQLTASAVLLVAAS